MRPARSRRKRTCSRRRSSRRARTAPAAATPLPASACSAPASRRFVGKTLTNRPRWLIWIARFGWDFPGPLRLATLALSGRARAPDKRFPTMAKAVTIKVKLLSTADTGYYYVTKKNSRTMTDKLAMKKYDPVARKHVEFKEAKIK